MEYIVKCRKVIECTFVVGADTDEQADEKLTTGQYRYKAEQVKTMDSYLGYEYVTYEKVSGTGDGAVICSIEDLCEALGTTVDGIERLMYKNTACGMPISWDDNGVTLVGYAEGADCDHPSECLLFPFTMKDFDQTVQGLEYAADELWHEWNDDEDEEE